MKNAAQNKTVLVFVYNADSGIINTIKDIAHKLIKPDTYPCQLCSLTYSACGMRQEWQQFLHGLDISYEFLHKDQFKAKYPEITTELPAIFKLSEEGIIPWLNSNEINQCQTLIDLRELITDHL